MKKMADQMRAEGLEEQALEIEGIYNPAFQ